ncbi:helix-turn-helix domain-containing protein [Streptomyces sp. FXJ1.172]|uniref:helix-turn-helix domain-containing protein n=1 Tax=Streptomyces sp. FXJ1.172 TaxID=710705 RepID=UPI0007CF753D|nr:helix-turn-helix domain-containing protein [Streptomyces sp. FXJ1.172]WEO94241.1 helix-turn-helix domain-containing protein [Streptomyces sp. FXJ1.172]
MPERTFDGRELRNRRVLLRQSQSELGAVLGVGTNAVSRWETGQATPPPERLPGIAAALDADLDDLFPRLEPPNLADLRCDAGMTQADTVAVTRTRSPMSVRAAERGKRPLPESFHEPLADAYGVTVPELLAAQKRSFGHVVPVRAPTGAPATAVADKLAHLRDDVFRGALPPDAEIAAEGNRKAGKPVLTQALVEALRLGTCAGPSDEILNALALALDVPSVFFQSPDPQIEQLVVSTRAVRNSFTVEAARGGEHEIPAAARAELLDFISSTMAEILGPESGVLE